MNRKYQNAAPGQLSKTSGTARQPHAPNSIPPDPVVSEPTSVPVSQTSEEENVHDLRIMGSAQEHQGSKLSMGAQQGQALNSDSLGPITSAQRTSVTAGQTSGQENVGDVEPKGFAGGNFSIGARQSQAPNSSFPGPIIKEPPSAPVSQTSVQGNVHDFKSMGSAPEHPGSRISTRARQSQGPNSDSPGRVISSQRTSLPAGQVSGQENVGYLEKKGSAGEQLSKTSIRARQSQAPNSSSPAPTISEPPSVPVSQITAQGNFHDLKSMGSAEEQPGTRIPIRARQSQALNLGSPNQLTGAQRTSVPTGQTSGQVNVSGLVSELEHKESAGEQLSKTPITARQSRALNAGSPIVIEPTSVTVSQASGQEIVGEKLSKTSITTRQSQALNSSSPIVIEPTFITGQPSGQENLVHNLESKGSAEGEFSRPSIRARQSRATNPMPPDRLVPNEPTPVPAGQNSETVHDLDRKESAGGNPSKTSIRVTQLVPQNSTSPTTSEATSIRVGQTSEQENLHDLEGKGFAEKKLSNTTIKARQSQGSSSTSRGPSQSHPQEIPSRQSQAIDGPLTSEVQDLLLEWTKQQNVNSENQVSKNSLRARQSRGIPGADTAISEPILAALGQGPQYDGAHPWNEKERGSNFDADPDEAVENLTRKPKDPIEEQRSDHLNPDGPEPRRSLKDQPQSSEGSKNTRYPSDHPQFASTNSELSEPLAHSTAELSELEKLVSMRIETTKYLTLASRKAPRQLCVGVIEEPAPVASGPQPTLSPVPNSILESKTGGDFTKETTDSDFDDGLNPLSPEGDTKHPQPTVLPKFSPAPGDVIIAANPAKQNCLKIQLESDSFKDVEGPAVVEAKPLEFYPSNDPSLLHGLLSIYQDSFFFIDEGDYRKSVQDVYKFQQGDIVARLGYFNRQWHWSHAHTFDFYMYYPRPLEGACCQGGSTALGPWFKLNKNRDHQPHPGSTTTQNGGLEPDPPPKCPDPGSINPTDQLLPFSTLPYPFDFQAGDILIHQTTDKTLLPPWNIGLHITVENSKNKGHLEKIAQPFDKVLRYGICVKQQADGTREATKIHAHLFQICEARECKFLGKYEGLFNHLATIPALIRLKANFPQPGDIFINRHCCRQWDAQEQVGGLVEIYRDEAFFQALMKASSEDALQGGNNHRWGIGGDTTIVRFGTFAGEKWNWMPKPTVDIFILNTRASLLCRHSQILWEDKWRPKANYNFRVHNGKRMWEVPTNFKPINGDVIIRFLGTPHNGQEWEEQDFCHIGEQIVHIEFFNAIVRNVIANGDWLLRAGYECSDKNVNWTHATVELYHYVINPNNNKDRFWEFKGRDAYVFGTLQWPEKHGLFSRKQGDGSYENLDDDLNKKLTLPSEGKSDQSRAVRLFLTSIGLSSLS